MSVQLIAWAMEQRTGSPTRKAILVALADRANRDTLACHPSMETISFDTELGESTVRKATKELCDLGFISRRRRRRADGSLGVYEFSFPEAARARTPPLGGSADPPLGGSGHEPEEDLEPIGASPLGSSHKRIYDHWRAARGKTRSTYDTMSTERRRKIAARLKEFTEAQLIQAIDGVGRDPWPDRSKHDDITVIFRSREQVERFLEMGDAPSDLEAFYDHAKRAEAEARRRHAG